ncbi:MAG: DUF4352 domain-containing protein [Rubrobacter sp.]|nr:DUF4352 domain-containing protein [Rubrobacter sp.]
MGKKVLIGCGALSVLAVLAIVFLVVVVGLSGGGTETAGEDGGGGGQSNGGGSDTGEAEQPTGAVGENLTVGDAEWIVNSAIETDQLQSQFGGPAAQGNLIVVDFTFTNNTGEAVTLDPATMTLIDGQDRQFDADTDQFEYIPDGRDLFLEQVNPGVTQEGQVIFSVAPGASGFTLQAGDTDMFSDENGLINLGF